MNVRHASALALVPWYLMMPPVGKTGRLNLDVKAPFSLWQTFKVYDTEKQCQSEKTAIVEKANELLRDPENKRYADLIAGEATPTSQNSTRWATHCAAGFGFGRCTDARAEPGTAQMGGSTARGSLLMSPSTCGVILPMEQWR